jgi:hypothetical protein
MSLIRRYRKWLLIGVGLVAVAVLLRIVFILPNTPRTEHSLIAVSHPINGVVFVARLGSDRLHPKHTQTLHMELLASQPYDPASLTVCAQSPTGPEECQPWPRRDGQLTQSMDLYFDPRAETLSEFFTVTVLASRYPPPSTTKGKAASHTPKSATAAAPKTFEESILRLGPLRVERFNATTDKWLRFLARLRGILKDLALPVLLAFLGYLFTKQQSRKAEQDEVRRALLGKVQGLTKQFYTHIVHHARDTITALKDFKHHQNEAVRVPQKAAEHRQKADGSQREATYNLLGVLLFNYRLKEQEGAVFFSSLAAERVYANCISLLVGQAQSMLGGEQAYRRTLDAFGDLRKPIAPAPAGGVAAAPPASPRPNVPGTQQALAPVAAGAPAAAKDAETPPPRLSDFLNSNIPTLPLSADPVLLSTLDFLIAVTSYEYDAPLYEHWYRLPGKVEFGQKFPSAGDLTASTQDSDKKKKAWKSILRESRQWLGDKRSDENYLKRLRTLDESFQPTLPAD